MRHHATLTANINCHERSQHQERYSEGGRAELPSILAQWSHTRHTQFSQQQVVTTHVKCCLPGKLTWTWELRDLIGTQATTAWHIPKPQLPKKQAVVQDNPYCWHQQPKHRKFPSQAGTVGTTPYRGHEPHATMMAMKFDHRCSSSFKGSVSSLENSQS